MQPRWLQAAVKLEEEEELATLLGLDVWREPINGEKKTLKTGGFVF